MSATVIARKEALVYDLKLERYLKSLVNGNVKSMSPKTTEKRAHLLSIVRTLEKKFASALAKTEKISKVREQLHEKSNDLQKHLDLNAELLEEYPDSHPRRSELRNERIGLLNEMKGATKLLNSSKSDLKAALKQKLTSESLLAEARKDLHLLGQKEFLSVCKESVESRISYYEGQLAIVEDRLDRIRKGHLVIAKNKDFALAHLRSNAEGYCEIITRLKNGYDLPPTEKCKFKDYFTIMSANGVKAIINLPLTDKDIVEHAKVNIRIMLLFRGLKKRENILATSKDSAERAKARSEISEIKGFIKTRDDELRKLVLAIWSKHGAADRDTISTGCDRGLIPSEVIALLRSYDAKDLCQIFRDILKERGCKSQFLETQYEALKNHVVVPSSSLIVTTMRLTSRQCGYTNTRDNADYLYEIITRLSAYQRLGSVYCD